MAGTRSQHYRVNSHQPETTQSIPDTPYICLKEGLWLPYKNLTNHTILVIIQRLPNMFTGQGPPEVPHVRISNKFLTFETRNYAIIDSARVRALGGDGGKLTPTFELAQHVSWNLIPSPS
jgi:hypothetical protein